MQFSSLAIWLAALPAQEIEMPPQVVFGDAWNSPVLQGLPGRVDLEAALRGNGVRLDQADIVYVNEEENALGWRNLAQTTDQLSAEVARPGKESCTTAEGDQEPMVDPRLHLYPGPSEDAGEEIQSSFASIPFFAIGRDNTGEDAVYTALLPGDQITLVQAFSPEGDEFGELVTLERAETTIQLRRINGEARLCVTRDQPTEP